MHQKQVPILIITSMMLAFSMMFSIFTSMVVEDLAYQLIIQVLAVIATAAGGVFVGIYYPRSQREENGLDEAIATLTKRIDSLIREISVSTFDEASVGQQISQVKANVSQVAKMLAYHIADPSQTIVVSADGSVRYAGSSPRRKSQSQSPAGTANPQAPHDQLPKDSTQSQSVQR